MSGRGRLPAIVLLAAALHALGIARTILPAQDGLKFIRIARQFQDGPATDVIRQSDRHPLYPAMIALAEPVIAGFAGHGPDTWRVAAQVVAALASIALLLPLYSLTRTLFDARIAALAVLLYVVLPLPAEVGRDTLSDSLGLLATLTALRLGSAALETGGARAFVGCGLAAGLGYLARPEVALVPLAVGFTLVARDWRLRPAILRRAALELSTLGVTFLTLVGGYALVKGEVSEKLALQYAAGIAPHRSPVLKAPRWLPPGLDDPRWDFSPKEESASDAGPALGQLVARWAEGLGGIFGLFAIWGAVRGRFLRDLIARERAAEESARAVNVGVASMRESQRRLPPTPHSQGGEYERRGSLLRLPPLRRGGWGGSDFSRSEPATTLRALLTVYLVLYAAVLVRHVGMLGYLSDRHVLPLVAVALPWSAAGTYVCARGVALALGWTSRRARWVGAVLVVIAILGAIALPQWRPGHRSRWGHWAAGSWLREHAAPSDAVLDTRGWAAFVSNLQSYDYWHVRQALTDSHLAYIVVGVDELSAASRRGATLRAVLAYSAVPIVGFPEDRDGATVGVRVYRYHRPDSWEGLCP